MTVPVQHPMYIDGQFVAWQGDAWIDVINPATEEVISRIPTAPPRTPARPLTRQSARRLAGRRCLPLNAPAGYAKFPPGSASASAKSAR